MKVPFNKDALQHEIWLSSKVCANAFVKNKGTFQLYIHKFSKLFKLCLCTYFTECHFSRQFRFLLNCI